MTSTAEFLSAHLGALPSVWPVIIKSSSGAFRGGRMGDSLGNPVASISRPTTGQPAASISRPTTGQPAASISRPIYLLLLNQSQAFHDQRLDNQLQAYLLMLNQSQATVYPVDRKSSRRKRRRVANQSTKNPVARKLEKVTICSTMKRKPDAKLLQREKRLYQSTGLQWSENQTQDIQSQYLKFQQ
ncbi:hypothetical protein F511_05651 [Dorcoceras hygrometricum]|uniref:Uncharacterized protein n=1 Tax=Dorcoceras hygrometricum TaxID=472368 RepID=A0A2Z7BGB3_9LAMI|nr:hypothetical protein F511_05651 [Dorcoceras hygrometricum]